MRQVIRKQAAFWKKSCGKENEEKKQSFLKQSHERKK